MTPEISQTVCGALPRPGFSLERAESVLFDPFIHFQSWKVILNLKLGHANPVDTACMQVAMQGEFLVSGVGASIVLRIS